MEDKETTMKSLIFEVIKAVIFARKRYKEDTLKEKIIKDAREFILEAENLNRFEMILDEVLKLNQKELVIMAINLTRELSDVKI